VPNIANLFLVTPASTDRRSVLVHQTAWRNAFLRDLSKIMADAERATRSTRSAWK
jgi:hypothetical protein